MFPVANLWEIPLGAMETVPRQGLAPSPGDPGITPGEGTAELPARPWGILAIAVELAWICLR